MENLEPNLLEHPNLWKWISALALIISIVALVSIYTQISKANADYICTLIVEENDPCGNGSWSDWGTVSTTGDEDQCTQSVVEKRTYTGTREIRHILQYLNLRTSCDSQYTQSGNGGRGGASGFHGGSIISQTAACQIEEIRTTVESLSGEDEDSCDVDTTIIKTKTDLETSTTNTNISAKSQLNDFRKSKIDGKITSSSDRVNGGDSVIIEWQGVEMTSCTVTGSNGDSWTGTSGEQLSSPLTSSTTFTLDCTAFDGSKIQEIIEVGIVPRFQEI